MSKHGNTKYKFDKLIKIGDSIIEKPSNIYSLKAAFRIYNNNLEKSGNPKLKVIWSDHGGKSVGIEVIGFSNSLEEA